MTGDVGIVAVAEQIKNIIFQKILVMNYNTFFKSIQKIQKRATFKKSL